MRYLSQEIRPLLERNEILGLVLVDGEGMVLDAEGGLYPPEHLAALFSPLYRMLDDIQHNINVEGIEEISIRTLNPRMRIIVQGFSVQQSPYLIIALYPITTFYRQVTSDIIRIVKDCIRRLTPHPADGGDPSASGSTGPGEP
ncbi:MAG: hypothetical protein JW747_08575 [Candidatus Aminicenantes bacterium]|nr:hypothetical protein [Candidatus Aminicenantes bacterium]